MDGESVVLVLVVFVYLLYVAVSRRNWNAWDLRYGERTDVESTGSSGDAQSVSQGEKRAMVVLRRCAEQSM